MQTGFSGYNLTWCFLLRTFLVLYVSVLRLVVLYYMYKKIALSLCFTLLLGLLTACSPKGFLNLKQPESSNANTSKNNRKTKGNQKIGAPIALPPAFKSQPLKPGQTNTQYMPNGLPALKPMMGINANTLFTKDIKNTGDRFNRVENAVVDLRQEFDTYKPSIVRLAAVESDIQNLIKELEVLLQETPASNPPQTLITPPTTTPPATPQLQVKQIEPALPQKVDKTPPPTIKKKTPPPTKHDGLVSLNLRIGEHADKSRIAFDTNHRIDFSIDLDNDENLIIIEIPNARWIDKKNKTFKDSKLLESYSTSPINNDKGTMIVLSLKKTTNILREKRLSPDKDTPYHRIYFDLSH